MFIILVLFLAAFVFVIWPSFSKAQQTVSQQAENLHLYKERQQEIRDAGYDAEEEAAALMELDRELLTTSEDQNANLQANRNTRILTAFAVFALMSAGVIVLYQKYGAQEELYTTQLLNKAAQTQLNDEERQELLAGLALVAEKNPGHNEWRYLYARLLMAEGQFDQAIENYNQVLAELPEEASQDKAATLVQRAQAKFYRDQQRANQDSYNDIEQALALAPEHRQGLGLAGILAYDLKKYQQSLQHWKSLWLMMAGSGEAQALESGIQKVAEKLREQGENVDLSWMKAVEVKVLVQLAPHLRDQVSDTDAVFVLAKAVSGPVMPLAATRIMVTELPKQITLTDAMGMVPGLSLSQMDEVQVIARVAKGGQPIAQPGDLQGIRSPVPTRSDNIIKLTIDQVVP